jgi:NAD(P)-dependent dehydrogenase (short-subunit alcohol dehydrogenase family)/putative sterol carrier protein
MVQFEGGGRFMADFTDCELSDVKVGQKVAMAFRKRYTDRERGFTGYFWKAIPIPTQEAAPAGEKQIRFDGKVAVVTGAGAGLGRVYAIELAKRGAKVVVNDLGGARDGTGEGSASPADKVVEEIGALGGEAVASYDSVATVAGGEAIINRALEAFGRVDILINNAGILRDKTLAKMEPSEWAAVESVHLNGAYNVTRPAFAKMRQDGYGRIIVTTSAAGLYGNFGQTNYSAAKMGLVGFMNTLKLEGDKHNIRINAVAPVAATRLTEDILPPDLLERSKPEFVAPLVLYLCWEGCEETGMIFNAGMGSFNRAAVLTGPGAVVGDGKTPPTPEQIADTWDAINDMSGAVESCNATSALGLMVEAFTPKSEQPEGTGGPTVRTVFDRIADSFQADKAEGVDVVFQFKIGGAGGGEWYVVVKGGRCESGRGTHDKPTTTIIMSDEDFLSLIQGRLNAMVAYTTGRLKIEGDLLKSQLIEKLFKF